MALRGEWNFGFSINTPAAVEMKRQSEQLYLKMSFVNNATMMANVKLMWYENGLNGIIFEVTGPE